jgi:hypothetical protein
VKTLPLVVWLFAYSGLGALLLPLALIFCVEGVASWRTHPENLALAVAAGLFLVAWPLSALAGWLLLLLGRIRAAWRASAWTAAGLLSLWLCGLVITAFLGRRH